MNYLEELENMVIEALVEITQEYKNIITKEILYTLEEVMHNIIKIYKETKYDELTEHFILNNLSLYKQYHKEGFRFVLTGDVSEMNRINDEIDNKKRY